MTKLKPLMSSLSMEWATPQDFYDKLNSEFGFNLDPCATRETAKCKTYFTPESDGLKQDWGGRKVGLATYKIGTHKEVRITYKHSDGSLVYPQPLYISGEKARTLTIKIESEYDEPSGEG